MNYDMMSLSRKSMAVLLAILQMYAEYVVAVAGMLNYLLTAHVQIYKYTSMCHLALLYTHLLPGGNGPELLSGISQVYRVHCEPKKKKREKRKEKVSTLGWT